MRWSECWCPPKIHMLDPNAKYDNTKRWKSLTKWLSHKGRALMNGINALLRDCRELPSPLLPQEDVATKCYRKQRASPFGTAIFWGFNLWFPTSQNCKQNTIFCLYTTPSKVFCYSSLKQQRQFPISHLICYWCYPKVFLPNFHVYT